MVIERLFITGFPRLGRLWLLELEARCSAIWQTSASGQQQPISSLALDRLVPATRSRSNVSLMASDATQVVEFDYAQEREDWVLE